ncbi:hypothetical protein [Ferruginibacter sp.]
MIKKLVLVICLFIACEKVFCQELEGEWKGSFTKSEVGSAFVMGGQTEISLLFFKLSDTLFQAFSKTVVKHGKDIDSSICILTGSFTASNVLTLKEIKSVRKFAGDTGDDCFQTMELTYNKGKRSLSLEGFWDTDEDRCGHGRIQLTKKIVAK